MATAIPHVATFGFVLLLIACTNGESPSPSPSSQNPPSGPAPARLLVVTHTAGFRHDSIPAAEAALRTIGTDSGLFQVEFCRTADEVRNRLTTAGLATVDAVFFANTTGNLGIPDMAAFLAWIAGGKAFLGAHSASDTYHESPEFLAMLGGEFDTHGSIVEAELRVNEPSNPAVAHLATEIPDDRRMVSIPFRGIGFDDSPVVRSQPSRRPRRRGRSSQSANRVAEDPRLRPGVLHRARPSLGSVGRRPFQDASSGGSTLGFG